MTSVEFACRRIENQILQFGLPVANRFQQEIKCSNKKNIIDCEPSVSVCTFRFLVAVQLTDPWPSIVSLMFLLFLIGNATKIWRDRDPTIWPSSSSSPAAPAADGAESKKEQKEVRKNIACSVVQSRLPICVPNTSWFKFLVTASCRNIPKYIGLASTILQRSRWRAQSNLVGAAWSFLKFLWVLTQKKKACKHQSYAKRWIVMHRDTRHIHQ